MVIAKNPQDKTIKLGIYFFTNKMPQKRQAWSSGVVVVKTNKEHGIRASESNRAHFTSLEGVEDAVRTVLRQAGISLVQEEKGSKKRYLVEL
jgi:hypothetical protein